MWTNQGKFCCTEIWKTHLPCAQTSRLDTQCEWLQMLFSHRPSNPYNNFRNTLFACGFAFGLSTLSGRLFWRMYKTVTSLWSYLEVHQNPEGRASQDSWHYKKLYHLEGKKCSIHKIDRRRHSKSQWQFDQYIFHRVYVEFKGKATKIS